MPEAWLQLGMEEAEIFNTKPRNIIKGVNKGGAWLVLSTFSRSSLGGNRGSTKVKTGHVPTVVVKAMHRYMCHKEKYGTYTRLT